MNRPDNATTKTHEAVVGFQRTLTAVERAKEQLQLAELEHAAAKKELGNWMCPPDAKAQEHFNMWYGDGILHVIVLDTDRSVPEPYFIQWRTKPSPKVKCEMGI